MSTDPPHAPRPAPRPRGRTARETARDLAKIALAGATIALVAWAAGVFDVQGRVAPAKADIVDILQGRHTGPERFAKALENLGHGRPQSYELNGNLVYFSHRQAAAPVEELVGLYQEEFVRQGLNERPYTRLVPEEDRARFMTGLSGGIVPHAIAPGYAAMGGVVARLNVQDESELMRTWDPQMNEDELFRGHRWVEIFEEPGAGTATVLASWSDEAFVYSKMVPGASEAADQGFDAEIPACPGCTRINRMVDLGQRPAPHESNVFSTGHSLEQIEQFYRFSMRARGWQLVPSQDISQIALREDVAPGTEDLRTLQFGRGEDLLDVVLYRDVKAGTQVHTSLWRDAAP